MMIRVRHPERSEGYAVVFACRFLAALGMTLAFASSASAQTTVDTTVVIKATGPVLEFEPATLFLKEGTRVRLRFINDGTLPHNVVFVRDEDDIDPLAQAAMSEGGDYVPQAMKARMFAFTKLASPGQTVETTFVVPPAGKYMYVCLMSGHANLMLGTLRSLR
jgi:plastocyanin